MENNLEDKDKKEESTLARYHKRKRKRNRIILFSLSIIFVVLALFFLVNYLIINIKYGIKFTEDTNINYAINLVENNFYKATQIKEPMDVVASLIDSIDVEFKYNMNLLQEVDYEYNYKIFANITLKEISKTNLIYNDEQIAITKEPQQGSGNKLEIVEKINIKYSDYNNQINNLINEYRLNNTESEMTLTMQLEVINKATGKKINKASNVMSVVIPLDTKTIEITVNEALKNSEGEIILKEIDTEKSNKYLTLTIISAIFGIGFFIALLKYNSKTRSAKRMYEDEIKKIVFDYKSYIQTINTMIDYRKYNRININSFTELMGIREEVQSPILMYVDKKDEKTIFMIIKDEILFTYILGAKLIKAQLIEKSKKKKGEKPNEKNN